ncbi:MAG TPA: hypothetical protein V6D20_01630, partial [Candidatus Obscuribacterales bacterium]
GHGYSNHKQALIALRPHLQNILGFAFVLGHQFYRPFRADFFKQALLNSEGTLLANIVTVNFFLFVVPPGSGAILENMQPPSFNATGCNMYLLTQEAVPPAWAHLRVLRLHTPYPAATFTQPNTQGKYRVRDGESKWPWAKLYLVGEPAAGKTTFLQWIQKDPVALSHLKTPGIDIMTVDLLNWQDVALDSRNIFELPNASPSKNILL